MKASYLGKVIEYFNPMQSLDESRKDWYVERPDSPHEEIKVELLNDPSPLKILFSGHIGSGKTSALNKLAADPEIRARFFTVQFSVERDLNIFDLTYTDLLLAIGNQLFDAVDHELSLPDKLKTDLNAWATEISRVWNRSDLAEVVVEGGIRAWLLKAVGTLKTGYEERRSSGRGLSPACRN